MAERDALIATLQSQLSQAKAQLSQTKAQLGRSQARVVELENLVATLEARLGENSQNSNRPPSSDSPEQRKRRPKRPPSRRPRGAQRGHKGHRRQLLPPEQVTQLVELFPTHCSRCHKRLKKLSQGQPVRHQVIELPELKADVIEYQMHHVRCECGKLNTASLPAGTAKTLCGPRLTALVAMMTGVVHASRRGTEQFLSDVLNLDFSLGMVSESEERVSEAIAPCEEQVKEQVLEYRVKNIDGTRWQEAGQFRNLWVIATPLATWFAIVRDASQERLKKLLEGRQRGILTSDRGSQFGFWPMEKRQICWQHLKRLFERYSEQDGITGILGNKLRRFSELLFNTWHRFCDRVITRKQLIQQIGGLRVMMEACLEEGAALEVRKKKKKGGAQAKAVSVRGSCKNILKHRAALWTFAKHPGVEPTNNHAEQQLREFVLWRKKCFGSQSERGCRFAQRIMTVVHTLRKQKRPVFKFLVEACQAHMGVGVMPSLA